MRRSTSRGLLLVGGILVCTSLPALAQTSELYLGEWSSPEVFVVQNGAIVRQFNRSGTTDGPGLVVQNTIKFIGQDGGNLGKEYALDGTPLGGSYLNPGFTSLYDGATDGTHNWSIAHNDFDTNFAIVEADTDWNSMSVLFVPVNRSSGIAYDANTGTLWITNNSGGSSAIQQFDMTGNLLSEFPAVHSGGGYGLAWDPADDTLWLPGAFGTGGHLFQYDKSGNLLQDIVISGMTTQILSAEFGAGGPSDCLTMAVSTLTAGQSASWDVSGATPGAEVAVVYGFGPGSTVLNGFAGYCADFGIKGVNANQVICRKAADGAGNLSCKVTIPKSAGGVRVLSQAAERGTCPDACMSNLDDQVVQ